MFRLDVDFRRLYMQRYDPCPVALWVRPIRGRNKEDQLLVMYGQGGGPVPPEIVHEWITRALRGEL